MFGEKTVQYVSEGEVIATDETTLAEWISEYCEDEFEDWLDEEYGDFEFSTGYYTPSEIMRMFRDHTFGMSYYENEMGHWIKDIVLADPTELDRLGIQIVEVLPPEEREYTIEPYAEPWNVRGLDINGYYAQAADMEVGDVYDSGAYRVVRTKNAKGRRFF